MKDALIRVIKLNFWFQFFEKSQKNSLNIKKYVIYIKLEYKISRDKSLTKAKSRSDVVYRTSIQRFHHESVNFRDFFVHNLTRFL